MPDDAVGFILKSAAAATECRSVAQWWPAHRIAARLWRDALDCAIAAGFSADRVGWAFASGYQCALRALFPGAPDDRVAALCVTEAGGNRPRAIESSLRRVAGGWMLSGAKRWTTLGPEGALFYVAARDASAHGERVALKIARVDAGSPGVTVEPIPDTRFVPEVPHARLRFEDVRLADDALLPGDGYEAYVKPFRSVEDLHVHAAIIAYLIREARRLGWPAAWLERAAAQLHALRSLATGDPAAPATHVALAGALAAGDELLAGADACWAKADTDAGSARWRRDRELFKIASAAREQRTVRAWERLRQAT